MLVHVIPNADMFALGIFAAALMALVIAVMNWLSNMQHRVPLFGYICAVLLSADAVLFIPNGKWSYSAAFVGVLILILAEVYREKVLGRT